MILAAVTASLARLRRGKKGGLFSVLAVTGRETESSAEPVRRGADGVLFTWMDACQSRVLRSRHLFRHKPDATRRVARTALKLNQIKAVANEQRKSTAKQSCKQDRKGRAAISQ